MMQSLIFTHLVPMHRRWTMQELLHEHEGVAGVITAFVALVSLENDPLATQVLAGFRGHRRALMVKRVLGTDECVS